MVDYPLTILGVSIFCYLLGSFLAIHLFQPRVKYKEAKNGPNSRR